jgi:transposase
MVTKSRRRSRRSQRRAQVAKPSGSISPRVQKVGPEHFGIVAVDCAKARSQWMLADFYGRILVAETEVDHTRQGFEAAVDALRRAIAAHEIQDLVAAIEQTGHYHRPVQRALAAAGFETRIVHPLTTQQFRIPADPGNKTDETDLKAIHRAAVNGFGLIEPPRDPIHDELRMLARHRRDLVEKNAALRNQLHVELDALLPGLTAAVGKILDHEPAWIIARHVGSARQIRTLGLEGLARLLDGRGIRYQRRTLTKILAWAERAHDSDNFTKVHKRILESLDDERQARLGRIRSLERDLAALLVQTPYVLLLSWPGINVVSAAELAGEMGPIQYYPSDGAITGRAGLFPSRYQSDKVDRSDGPLVSRANRALRYILLLIAENLLLCNAHFRRLGQQWKARGVDPRICHVRVAKRFCRIAYQMVAGRQVFRHPSCQKRHQILEKLSTFYCEHDTPVDQLLRDMTAAAGWIPPTEYAAEAEPFLASLPPGARANLPGANSEPHAPERPRITSRRGTGPRPLSAILPEVLLRLGVSLVQSKASEETDLT